MKIILYFAAEWCGPCREIIPIVKELSHEQIIAKFFIIDVDVDTEMTKDFNVTSVPTFVLMKDNVEIHRLVGSQTKDQLEELIRYEQ